VCFEQVLALSQSNHHQPYKGISRIAGGSAPLALGHTGGLSHIAVGAAQKLRCWQTLIVGLFTFGVVGSMVLLLIR
jgi:hypothetical protein